MRRFLTVLILMILIMSPCWSRTTTISSDELKLLKSSLRIALEELLISKELVVILQENLTIAEKRLADSSQSGNASDGYLKNLESQLERAKQQVISLETQITELMIQSEQDSIYLSDLKLEIQLQRDEHTEAIKVIITEYEDKLKIRNTVIVVESVLLVIVATVIVIFIVAD